MLSCVDASPGAAAVCRIGAQFCPKITSSPVSRFSRSSPKVKFNHRGAVTKNSQLTANTKKPTLKAVRVEISFFFLESRSVLSLESSYLLELIRVVHPPRVAPTLLSPIFRPSQHRVDNPTFLYKTSGSTAWRNVGGSATDGHVFAEAEGADFQRDRERAGDGAVQPGSVSALTRHGIERFD